MARLNSARNRNSSSQQELENERRAHGADNTRAGGAAQDAQAEAQRLRDELSRLKQQVNDEKSSHAADNSNAAREAQRLRDADARDSQDARDARAEAQRLRDELEQLRQQQAMDRTRPQAGTRAVAASELGTGVDSEDDPNAVFVYGRNGDGKTDKMCKALHAAGIPFTTRDFDQDKRYLKALQASGGPSSAKPVVVCRGKQAWWDDGNAKGDDMFGFAFEQTVAAELRHLMGTMTGPEVSVPVRADADIDTEIAERFLSMQQAFLKLDTNQDGRITVRELKQKCKEWNIPTSEAERAMGEADLNDDHELDFDEFARRFNSARPNASQKYGKKTNTRPGSRGHH